MAVIEPVETYLAAEDFTQLSEFGRIRNMDVKLAGMYVTRAHIRIAQWAPFQVLDAESDLGKQMASEMQLAVFIVAERIAMANPVVPMAAAGISSESIGHSQVSRAPGGGNSGKSVESEIVPTEVLDILTRWQEVGGHDLLAVQRTRVFDLPGGVAEEDENESVVVHGDFELLTPALTQRRGSI